MYAPMTAPQGAPLQQKNYFDKIALIDADRMKHVVCNDIWQMLQQNYSREEIPIFQLIEQRLDAIYNSFSAKAMIFCFSGKSFNTFRYNVALEKEYKGNRNREDPRGYDCKLDDMILVMDYVMQNTNSLLFPDLEADDLLCMLQYEDVNFESTFIYSNDKDLKQIPGFHMNQETMGLERISEEQAMRNLCFQLLKGDTVDNIAGLPGIGEVKALEILAKYTTKQLPSRILYEYQMKFGITMGTDAFVETWNLVKLRTNRGKFLREKYSKAFSLLELLKK